MTSSQREKSKERLALKAANDRFVETPCRLSPEEVRAIVDELGIYLEEATPAQLEAIEADPPTNPQAFAELLMRVAGLPTFGRGFAWVVELILRHFEGAAARR